MLDFGWIFRLSVLEVQSGCNCKGASAYSAVEIRISIFVKIFGSNVTESYIITEVNIKVLECHTDSDTENCVRYDKENKPGVANLMTIYSACTGKSYEEIEREFAGQGYGAFKPKVGEAVVETLRPIREETLRLLKDKAYLESVYRNGAEKASYVAEKTLRKVYKKIGFIAR